MRIFEENIRPTLALRVNCFPKHFRTNKKFFIFVHFYVIYSTRTQAEKDLLKQFALCSLYAVTFENETQNKKM